MSVQILHNDTDITSKTIAYTRFQSLCQGIGTLRLVFKGDETYTFIPYDRIVIYEDGIKKGLYYVSSIDRSDPDSTYIVDCQDETKKLKDYFIGQSYTIETPTTTRYWIEKFLDEAKSSYSINSTGNGSTLSNNTSLGYDDTLNTLTSLVQQTGWYFYTDADSTIQIGRISFDVENPVDTFVDTDIVELNHLKDDKNLRNKVTVWGSGDPGEKNWVFASSQAYSPYQIDSGDIRTAVLSNNFISDVSSAKNLANALLLESNHIIDTKVVALTGFRDLKVTDVVGIDSNYWSGNGIITTIEVQCSASGIITIITLDERCPRVFGYFDYGGYVYVGTTTSGVWRKPIKYDHTWEDFSSGLGTNLYIHDLYIANGKYVCIADNDGVTKNLYVRTSGNWSKISISSFTDPDGTIYASSLGVYNGCTINRLTNEVQAVFTLKDGIQTIGDNIIIPGTTMRSWLVKIAGNGVITKIPVVVNGHKEIYTFDLDNNGKDPYITTLGVGGYFTVERLNDIVLGTNTTAYKSQEVSIPYSFNNTPKESYETLNYRTFATDDIAVHGKYLYKASKTSSSVTIMRKQIYTGAEELLTVNLTQTASLGTELNKFALIDEDKGYFTCATYSGIDRYLTTGYFDFRLNTIQEYTPDSIYNTTEVKLYAFENYGVVLILTGQYIPEGSAVFDIKLYSKVLNRLTSFPKEIIYNIADSMDDLPEFNSSFIYNTVQFCVGCTFNESTNYRSVLFGRWTISGLDYAVIDPSTFVEPNFDTTSVLPTSSAKGIHMFGSEIYQIVDITFTDPLGINLPKYRYGVITFNSYYPSVASSWIIVPDNGEEYTYTIVGYERTKNTLSYIINKSGELHKVNFSSGTEYTYSNSTAISVQGDDVDYGTIYTEIVNDAGTDYVVVNKKVNTTVTEILRFEGSENSFVRLLGSYIITDNKIFYDEEDADYEPSYGMGLIKYLDGNFILVDKLGYKSKVETSTDYPIVVYGGNTSWGNGEFLYSPDGEPNSLKYVSLINPDYPEGREYPIDVRNFILSIKDGESTSPSRCSFVTIDQVYNSEAQLWILDYDQNIYVDPLGVDKFQKYYTFDEKIYYIETTNKYAQPYMFVSTGASPSSFYQKDSYDFFNEDAGDYSTFVNRTSNLPSTGITCIRCDDRI